MKRKAVFVGLGLSVLIALLAIQTYPHFQAQVRPGSSVTGTSYSTDGTISVQGTGQVDVQPDRAIVTVGVVTNASTAAIAVQANANIMTSVVSALNDVGITNSNIETTSYYVSAQWSCCYGPSTVIGYQVTNDLRVTVLASGQSLGMLGTEVGQVIDAAASNGANQIYGIQFTASRSTFQQAHQTALKLAAQDASQQAHIIASALNVTITGLISASPNPGYVPSLYFRGFAMAASASATPVLPQQSLTVTATVAAVFSIG